MRPGYIPQYNGLPYNPLLATNVTSTTYLYSTPQSTGMCVQVGLFVAVELNGGATSAEFKVQQALSAVADDIWFDSPLLDVANKTTVSNEFVSVLKSNVVSITADTALDPLGPAAFPIFMPFFRLAYKITGAGNADLTAYITQVLT